MLFSHDGFLLGVSRVGLSCPQHPKKSEGSFLRHELFLDPLRNKNENPHPTKTSWLCFTRATSMKVGEQKSMAVGEKRETWWMSAMWWVSEWEERERERKRARSERKVGRKFLPCRHLALHEANWYSQQTYRRLDTSHYCTSIIIPHLAGHGQSVPTLASSFINYWYKEDKGAIVGVSQWPLTIIIPQE